MDAVIARAFFDELGKIAGIANLPVPKFMQAAGAKMVKGKFLPGAGAAAVKKPLSTADRLNKAHTMGKIQTGKIPAPPSARKRVEHLAKSDPELQGLMGQAGQVGELKGSGTGLGAAFYRGSGGGTGSVGHVKQRLRETVSKAPRQTVQQATAQSHAAQQTARIAGKANKRLASPRFVGQVAP